MKKNITINFLFYFFPCVAFLITFCPNGAFAVNAFDHSHNLWQKVLDNHLVIYNKQSYFDFGALKKSPGAFNKYLSSLSAVTARQYNSFSQEQKLSFLINAYNAFTVKLIVNNYPIESIKNIGGFFSNPWKEEFFTLFGEKACLDYIEHGLLRKKFNEPRIHFSINCAAKACPSMQNKAFTPDNLEELFEKGGRDFLNDITKNYFDFNNETLKISKIFDWFEKDFIKKYGSIESFLASRITTNERFQKNILQGKYKIYYLSYDWSLIDKQQ